MQAVVDDLNRQAWRLRRTDAPRAQRLAHEALAQADVAGYPGGQVQALWLLATCALDAASYAAAEGFARRAERLAQELSSPEVQAAIGVTLGVCATRVGDFGTAIELHEASLGRYRALGLRRGEAEALMYLGGVHIDLTDNLRARGLLEEALTIFRAEAYPEGQMQALLMLAIATTALGENGRAYRYNHEALVLARGIGDTLTQARLLNNLGGTYENSGDSDKALACYLQALELSERLFNPHLRAMLLTNVAELYLHAGETARAARYADEALGLAKVNGYLRSQGEALETLGRIARQAGDFGGAAARFRAARHTAEAANDPFGQASSLAYLAELEHERGEPAAARRLFGESVEVARQTDNHEVEVRARLGLGKLLAALGEERAARTELARAAELAERLDYKRQLYEAYLALSESFERDGHLGEALAFYKRYTETGRQFLDKQIAERTAELMSRLELERAEKNTELERLRNHELAEANAALQATLAENTVLVAQLREQTARLERLTREDALTGLANRRHLEEQLALEFSSAKRYEHPLCAALVDIDNFKGVNDLLSHAVGDAVLRTVAEILARFVREVDLVARYGGEEFALALPRTALAGGLAVCERIREAVADHPWASIHPELRVTLSIGVAADLSVQDHEKLLALADDNLYRAKRAGKNRVSG